MPISRKVFYTRKDDDESDSECRWGRRDATENIIIPPSSQNSTSVLSAPTGGFSPPVGSVNTSPGSKFSSDLKALMPAPSPRTSSRFVRALQKNSSKLTPSAAEVLQNLSPSPGLTNVSSNVDCRPIEASEKCKRWLQKTCDPRVSIVSPMKPRPPLVDYSPSSDSTVSNRFVTPVKNVSGAVACDSGSSKQLPLQSRQLNFDDHSQRSVSEASSNQTPNKQIMHHSPSMARSDSNCLKEQIPPRYNGDCSSQSFINIQAGHKGKPHEKEAFCFPNKSSTLAHDSNNNLGQLNPSTFGKDTAPTRKSRLDRHKDSVKSFLDKSIEKVCTRLTASQNSGTPSTRKCISDQQKSNVKSVCDKVAEEVCSNLPAASLNADESFNDFVSTQKDLLAEYNRGLHKKTQVVAAANSCKEDGSHNKAVVSVSKDKVCSKSSESPLRMKGLLKSIKDTDTVLLGKAPLCASGSVTPTKTPVCLPRRTSKRLVSCQTYSFGKDASDVDEDDEYDFSSGSSDNFVPPHIEITDSSDDSSASEEILTEKKTNHGDEPTRMMYFEVNSQDSSVSDQSSSRKSDHNLEEDSPMNEDNQGLFDLLEEEQDDAEANIGINVTSKVKKAERKSMRNTGKAYVTAKGKMIPARNPKPITCSHKGDTYQCTTILTPDNVETLHEEYWGLGSYNKRVQYVASRMESSKCLRTRIRGVNRLKKRNTVNKYYVEVNGSRYRVCKSSFENVFSETDTFTRNVCQKKKKTVSGFPGDDGRGGHKNLKHALTTEKKVAIRMHINSFPAYVSHYCRKQTQQKYLTSHLTVAEMHRLYLRGPNPKVGYSSYLRIFKSMKLKFKPPLSDTCARCDELDILIKAGGPFQADYQMKKDIHLRKSEKAFQLKRDAKEAAENDPTRRVLIFDLEQCLPTPDLKTGKVYYLRQLYAYNLTVYDSKTKLTHCYMWHEAEAARGANEIASCLCNHILDEIPSSVTHLTLFSDCCSGQNRNSIVTAMLLTSLEQHRGLKCVDHIFLVPGHTRMECDSKHSLVERFKKHSDRKLYVPSDWFKLVEEAGNGSFIVVKMKERLFNFQILLDKTKPLIKRQKTTDREDFKWTKTCWFRYVTEEKYKVLVKGNYNEDSPFNCLNLLRRGWKSPQLSSHVEKLSGDNHPISVKKKEDLLSLLSLIDEQFHQFYHDLVTDADMPDVDPDLPRANEELVDDVAGDSDQE